MSIHSDAFEKWYYGLKRFLPRVLLAKAAFEIGRRYERRLNGNS